MAEYDPLRSITLKQLRALRSVCDHGSLSLAADALLLTPPAVHSQLKTLEESFRTKLLDRRPSGAFEPTAEGALLLDAYDKATSALLRAVREIDALQRGVSGTVVLGVVSTGKYFAPGIVARLKQVHPGIEVRLVVGNRYEIIDGLHAERMDVAIMGRPPRQPEVTAFGIGPHPHVLIASPQNPLVHRSSVSKDDILSQHFIMRELGSGTRVLAMRFLDQLGDGQNYEFTEMGSNETIKQSVIAGLGVAIISAHTVIDELTSGRLALVPAKDLPIVRQWFVLHRTDMKLSGAMQTIIEQIRTDARDMLRADDVDAALGSHSPTG